MDLFDQSHMSNDTCLVQICNSVRIQPHGLSFDMVKKLGSYSNGYRNRSHLTPNTALEDTRPECGSISFSQPDKSNKPYIAHLYAQFDSGFSVETNRASLYYPHLQNDHHFMKNKHLDTKQNRLKNFQTCLEKLAEYLNKPKTSITKVVFPYRIGCNKAGGNWRSYLKLILMFRKKRQISVY